jgi:hypothetical protein
MLIYKYAVTYYCQIIFGKSDKISGPRTMRTFTATTLIAAPVERVWSVLVDVLHWPEWLPTVNSVEPLGPAALAVGACYKITQPKLRPAVWSVIQLEPHRLFSWETCSPGVRALAKHSLSSALGGSTGVTLQIDFSGPLSAIVGVVAGPLTREYLAREAASLKQRVEAGRS